MSIADPVGLGFTYTHLICSQGVN